ncbi:O-antigen ligase family protein [Salibacterium salarium]|nr:O-antigen ligase family protein [Salibacterium salarium]
MSNAGVEDKLPFYIVLLLTLTILIIGESINKNFILGIGLLCWAVIFFFSQTRGNIVFTIIKMLIFSIPLSFINIFGASYADLPISWFNIFYVGLFIVFIISWLKNGNVYFNYLSIISVCFTGISIFPLLVSYDLLDGLKQYINITTSFLFITIGSHLKHNLRTSDKNVLAIDYIMAAKITAIGVLVQVFYVNVLDREIGKYEYLGHVRHAYGYLFNDYSFLALYLASGAVMVFFFNRTLGKSNIKMIFEMGLLISASIMTSARTGIAALVIVFCIFSFFIIYKFMLKGTVYAILLIIFNLILIVFSYLMVMRVRGIDLLADSGRTQLNSRAFDVFLENPLIGIGFGADSYSSMVGVIPHNLFTQFLAQGGAILTIPIILFILSVLWFAFRNDRVLFPVITCVFIGGLFIPDVFNSRFLAVLLLLLSLEKEYPQKQVNQNSF